MTPGEATDWTSLVRDGGLSLAVVALSAVVAFLYRELKLERAARIADLERRISDEKENKVYALGLLERTTDAMRTVHEARR